MKQKIFLRIQIIAFALSCAAIAFSWLGSEKTAAGRAVTVLIGAVFWLGLIAGIVCTVLLSKQRRSVGATGGKIGVIAFFSNPIATAFDCLAAVALVISVVLLALKIGSVIGYFSIALFFFSFEMHCVLNGKNYKYFTSELEE